MTELFVAKWIADTQSEGPFRRVAIWLSGCKIRCPGCCNPELFERDPATKIQLDELLEQLSPALREAEGVSILGGEPTEHGEALVKLCRALHTRGHGIVLFSGRRYAKLRDTAALRGLWGALDTLVDGPFEREHRWDPDSQSAAPRRWLGSANQNLHHFSRRYADSALWQGEPGLEVLVRPDGTVEAHGFPTELSRLLVQLRRRSGPNQAMPSPR